MDKSIVFSLIFIVVSGVLYYFWQEHEASVVLMEAEIIPLIEPDEQSSQLSEEEAEILYPVPEQSVVPVIEEQTQVLEGPVADEIALPALNESDGLIEQAFARIYQAEKLLKLFIFKEFVRHVVVSIDNMTTKKLPRRFVFTKSLEDSFMVKLTSIDNEFILDERNFSRYQRFLHFANSVDNQQLASIYIKYYFLFQEAYDELGYSGRYFNDRLVQVIDHLLQTPEMQGPIMLLRPKVFYHFADPELEDLSAGQKILLRMGPDNAAMIKTRLKAMRQILTTLKPGQ
jgi:hypothetical protein